MKTEYWFVLRQSVFVWKKGCDCYFYDTVSFIGRRFLLKDADAMQFVDAIADIDNLYSLLLKQEKLETSGIKNIVEELIALGLAKLINKCSISGKPVQLPPVLNLQSEVHRLADGNQTDMTIGENVLDNLLVLNLKLNSDTTPLFMNKLAHLLGGLSHASLLELVIYGYSPSLPIPEAFWRQLEILPCMKRFVLRLNTETSYWIEQLKDHLLSNIIFDFEIQSDNPVSQIVKVLKTVKLDSKYSFQIFTEEDFAWAEQLINDYQIKKYRIVPRYNGQNLDFFRSCIYVDEQDILDSRQTKQNIFSHQALNTNDFGNLTITTDGKVYANVHQQSIGNIDEDIRILVYKEMSEGDSWLRVRDMAPCSNCVFQWLCPSPSDYELEIGKSNLCHIVKDE